MSVDRRTAALVVGSLMVSFLLAEGALWAAGFWMPTLYQPDRVTGSVHRPDLEFTYTDEGRAQVRTNSAGRRDRDHDRRKAPGTYRIAVLGDSYAEALQVDVPFWAVLEREARCLGKLEVINFGVSGYGTAQELLTLPRVWGYSPDLVLLAFLTGNDVRNNSKVLEPERLRPFYTIEGGELVLDNSFRNDPAFLKATSPLRSIVREASDYSRLLQLWRRARVVNLATVTSGYEAGLDDAVYQKPAGPWVEAWQITEALLAVMNAEVNARGVRFLVVTLSNSVQVHPDVAVTDGFAARLGVEDVFYPDRVVNEFGQRAGYDVLQLAPELQRIARRDRRYLHGFDGQGLGHWNADGHREAGRLIARYLCPS
jgi:hypothetical protein